MSSPCLISTFTTKSDVVDLSDDEVEGDDRKVAAAPAVADGAKEEDIDDEEKKIIL